METVHSAHASVHSPVGRFRSIYRPHTYRFRFTPVPSGIIQRHWYSRGWQALSQSYKTAPLSSCACVSRHLGVPTPNREILLVCFQSLFRSPTWDRSHVFVLGSPRELQSFMGLFIFLVLSVDLGSLHMRPILHGLAYRWIHTNSPWRGRVLP